MAAQTAAQEELDTLISRSARGDRISTHPGDAADYAHHDGPNPDLDDDTARTQRRIDDTMRLPTTRASGSPRLHLPPRDFDQGCVTGVKGVIADARSYEEARRGGGGAWTGRFAKGGKERARGSFLKSEASASDEDGDGDGDGDGDEDFLERWRLQRKVELQKGSDIRTRRTSPSVRRYGRFDEVNALGYLDAIEKVGRDTVVVVFVYDHECPVSQVISDALAPLVPAYPAIHFVRVHYEDIEFDNAGVPAILAYKNQGDLIANLTYIIDQIPENTLFDTRALENILHKHRVL